MPNTPPHLMANGNIRPSRFVKLDTSADKKVVEGTANAQIIGVSMEGTNYPPLNDLSITAYAAEAGQYMQMYGDGDVCLLEAGDAITMGDRLKSDSAGRGVAIATSGTTIQQIGAVALQTAAAAGELILVQVATLRSERPALA